LELPVPVDFSVKHVPDELAERLRRRAERNRRSLQCELLCILEAAAMAEDASARVAEPRQASYGSLKSKRAVAPGRKPLGRLTLEQLWERARRFGAPFPGESSTSLIRRDRDERSSR
jgi:plasmid stability protein